MLTVAVGDYEEGRWASLSAAPARAKELTDHLESAGFSAKLLESPTRKEVIETLATREELRLRGSTGPLVVVWTGHGAMSDLNRFYLAVNDTAPGAELADNAIEPSQLVGFADSCGSLDTLIVIDACYAGAGDQQVLDSVIAALEGKTYPGREPAFACVVSCKGYDRTEDGTFLARLLRVLDTSPPASSLGPFDLLWSPGRERIPLAAVIDRLGRETFNPRPRTWIGGYSDISFPNPLWTGAATASSSVGPAPGGAWHQAWILHDTNRDSGESPHHRAPRGRAGAVARVG